jgi:hypothetical protein
MAGTHDGRKGQNRGNRAPGTPRQKAADERREPRPERRMEMGGRARAAKVGRGGGRSVESGGDVSKAKTAAMARRGGAKGRSRSPRR